MATSVWTASVVVIGTANFRQHRNCSPASGHSSVNSTEGYQKGHALYETNKSKFIKALSSTLQVWTYNAHVHVSC